MYRPDHNRIGQALVLLPWDVEVVPDRNIDQDDVEEEGFTKRLRYWIHNLPKRSAWAI
jgi:hypothetical protein